MRLLAALATIGLSACSRGLESWCEPGPWQLERWSESPAVFAEVVVWPSARSVSFYRRAGFGPEEAPLVFDLAGD